MSGKGGSNSIVHMSPRAGAFRGSATQIQADPQSALRGMGEVHGQLASMRNCLETITAVITDPDVSLAKKRKALGRGRATASKVENAVITKKLMILRAPLKEFRLRLAQLEARLKATVQPT